MRTMNEQQRNQCEELASAGKKLCDQGLIRGWSGQLSKRCSEDNNTIIIKRSGGMLDNPAAYCVVNADGSVIPEDAKPSLMINVHRTIYECCTGVQAIVQCRGPYTDAITTILGEIPMSLELFWALGCKPVIISLDDLSGSDFNDFVKNINISITQVFNKNESKPTVICIPFYGSWVTGNGINDVVDRAIALEDLSKSAYLRHTLAISTQCECPNLPKWFEDILKGTIRPR